MEITCVFPSSPDSLPDKDILEAIPFSTFNAETHRGRELPAIVAIAKNNAIGKEGGIPWRLPEDMAHFKAETMGHPVIMGRKTWESLPKRPLPGRRNIVVSRNTEYEAPGGEVYSSLERAIAACEPAEVPVIIGGEGIYKAAMQMCTRLIVTEVDIDIPDADAFFPIIEEEKWKASESGDWQESKSGLNYRFITYIRR